MAHSLVFLICVLVFIDELLLLYKMEGERNRKKETKYSIFII